jgi:hypothetical protein
MKRVILTAYEFDSLPGHFCCQGDGTGCNLQAALSSAIRNLLKSPQLKRKRFHNFRMTVSIGKRINPVSGQEE